jgi:uncharacterized phosphosugar-binding protein
MTESNHNLDRSPAQVYLEQALAIVQHIRDTQMAALEQAAELCAHAIANDGLVHLFGTGHSRILIEEMFPRHGSFPGFHPIVELSLTYHNQVVGANGQRQAMFLEHVEGLGKVILSNFVFQPPDVFMVFSNSGVNEVVVEAALEARRRGLPVIAVVSREHCLASAPKHSSGQRLPDVADITLDNGTPAGDALVRVAGVEDPVGPGSTIGGAAVVNALKVSIAARLAALGHPPLVLTSSYFIGAAASAQRFEDSYNDYRRRVQRVFGCTD